MEDLFLNKAKNNGNTKFDHIQISIASPEMIYSWSHGEVKKPETINYRTLKPERSGLFCAQIFGPIKDNTCLCGKYKKPKHKGMICEKCGVEVTLASVRRERMGHIELVTPVVHTWFLRSLPSRIGLMLDMTLKTVESILYFENNVVIDGGLSGIATGRIVNAHETNDLMREHGDEITVSSGAEAIKTLLTQLNIKSEIDKIKFDIEHTNSEIKIKKLYKRLRVVEAFYNSKNKPEWMVLTHLPVIAPDLRPLVALDGGRFATSDLNELYRRVINRNNRLKKLMELKAPEIILRNEKRMLQESVDSLLDNGRSARVVVGNNKIPLKSLTDNIRGKKGRFRQNLLGKRVDYSGRSVITAGPTLKFYQCGLPKKMALELFRPFLYGQLQAQGYATTIKAARKIVDNQEDIIWDILEKVIYQHPVLLNRSPTLHRLSIQAFEPKLIEGKAIQLHPLLCAPFNADFDGDSMAVHIPLTIEAQLEARVLMLSSNNILNPSTGEPIINPSQDIILGLYYATLERAGAKGSGQLYDGYYPVKQAYDIGMLDIHAVIRVRMPDIGIITTTTGRVLLSVVLPDGVPFSSINKLLVKKEASKLVKECLDTTTQKATVILLDKLMYMGFQFATKSGISIGLDDMIVPDNREAKINTANKTVNDLIEQYRHGVISAEERFRTTINLWSKTNADIANRLEEELTYDSSTGEKMNPLFMMYHSGARGSMTQLRQVSGMRGLMASTTGEILETAITSNLKSGLSVLEYFTSTSGARKGLADTSLRTSTAGYLTRRLVDVSQDCIINEYDCNTSDGLTVKSIIQDGNLVIGMAERIVGRTLCEDMKLKNGTIIPKGALVKEQDVAAIKDSKIHVVKIRSPLMCKAKRGICTSCYGIDLTSGNKSTLGDVVGIIAAQSIGEPGTQLTMRTIHTGGTATSASNVFNIIAGYDCILHVHLSKSIINEEDKLIVLSHDALLELKDEHGQLLQEYMVPHGAYLNFLNGSKVKMGDVIAIWNPNVISLICEVDGYVKMENFQNNPSVQTIYDPFTGLQYYRIISSSGKHEFRPYIKIVDENSELISIPERNSIYYLTPGCNVYLNPGASIKAGNVIAVTIKESSKTQDIVGGLPRIIELFEARRPKAPCIMSEFTGRVTIGKDTRGKQKCIITYLDEYTGIEHKNDIIIPKGRLMTLAEGDYVKRGDIISEGQIDPHDLLRIKGLDDTIVFLVNTIQEIYQGQGVKINDKHIEIVVSAMLKKAIVTESSDHKFIPGEVVDLSHILKRNAYLASYDLPIIKYERILLGITKASLSTDSFLAAASFQDTTRILTEAAINGQIDYLLGLKENVLIGRLIPAGTSAPGIKERVKLSTGISTNNEIELTDLIDII